MQRRTFLQTLAVSAAGALRAESQGYPIGVTDWNLNKSAQLEAVPLAAKCGFDGVQIALGRNLVDGRLPLDDARIQERYQAAAREHGIQLTSTCLDRLHVNYLKNDPVAERWVLDGIRITKDMGLRVMLLPFFGEGQIKLPEEQQRVAEVLARLAPEAEKAGVILGLEDTISAEENVRIVDQTRSPAVVTYYDIGNSTVHGYDPVREIRWLGADRICEIHIKDNPHFLGQGEIDILAVADALADIGFDKWAVLETTAREDQVVADMQRNLEYFRQAAASKYA